VDQSQLARNGDGTEGEVLHTHGRWSELLDAELANWSRLSNAINLVVRTT
jgi:hypothetical protein